MRRACHCDVGCTVPVMAIDVWRPESGRVNHANGDDDATIRQLVCRRCFDACGVWAVLLHCAIGIDVVAGPAIGPEML